MKETIPVTAVIIDDEELARKIIVKYLEIHSRVKVVAECDNGFTALKVINKLKPEIIFLDIQMPKINGFEMLELLDEKPVIIFSTAHDQYAIKAFEQSAVDYLLKPYSQKRFDTAVKKALEKISSRQNYQSGFKKLSEHLDSSNEILQRVVVKTGNKVEIIPSGKIEYLEAAGDYVMIHTEKGRFLKQKTMKFFEFHLDPEMFIRVHRSYIVNIGLISGIEPYSKDSYILILKNGKKINLSKNGLKKLKEKLRF